MMVEGKAEWKCLIGGASKWKPGQILSKEILIGNEHLKLEARYIGKEQDAFAIEFSWQPSHFSFAEVLHSFGSIPLPPYIKRKVEQADTERYQTIFSKHEGSVAAPTAALHFTDRVFEDLKQKDIKPSYVTLHVGAGTFKPVKTETIEEHQMHAEQFVITKNTLQELISANEIIAVGTTSLRTLESLYWMGIKHINKHIDFALLGQWEAYQLEDDITYKESLQSLLNYLDKENKDELLCETSLLIRPAYTFHSAKGLITNFHQPQSTLLLLVSAFIGEDWKKVYRYALTNNFRFLSYGDSSLLWRKD
jgi:S-adenosylmethionine:tRNA ribosyltransferase-isomerase